MSAIELAGLVRRYGERAALADVSLTLRRRATLVVFGPNGAGKSTLLRVLATLLRPRGGAARVLGHDVRAEGWAVRGRIGFLGHDPLLYGDLSARENLAYHARLHGFAAERADRGAARGGRARATARDDRVHTLSRGMVQRLAVCRAVLHDPDVLLLDEPRANLDPAATELVEPLIGAQQRPHARRHEPRPRRRARRGRPRARPARRAHRAARPGSRGQRRRRSGRCTGERWRHRGGRARTPWPRRARAAQGAAARTACAADTRRDGALQRDDATSLFHFALRPRHRRRATSPPGSSG